jgi:hypothetical protein
MTARFLFLFALLLGGASAAQANLPDPSFDTQIERAGVQTSVIACSEGDGDVDILPALKDGDSSVEGMMPHTENTECSLISPLKQGP